MGEPDAGNPHVRFDEEGGDSLPYSTTRFARVSSPTASCCKWLRHMRTASRSERRGHAQELGILLLT